uniref:Myb/SANT-like domain-containing protein n=1 Tax=Fagus sylvatica TaxID=28930 RepID=A0A2N9FRU6_FAGSY
MGKTKETLNPNPKLSQNNSNVRALWTPQQIKIFCEACVDEGSETGLGWDVAKGTIAATDEWWDRKLTEVPEAAKFREKGLDNVDLLDIMFKDTAATGNLAWTPSSGVLPADFETPTEGDEEVSDEEVETHDLTQPPNSTQTTQDKGKKASIDLIHTWQREERGRSINADTPT